MDSKNKPIKAGVKRRNFLVNLPLAAAALTLNSAFGFPVSSEQGGGKLFLKMTDVNGTKSSDGSFQFSATDLELLKNGKMESLTIKIGYSFDQHSWQSLNTTVSDKYFMKQLGEIAQKAL